jgi:hypothetical protein
MATKREKQQAKALIDLEYGPQYNQVRDLWGQTRKQYLNDLSGARTIADSVTRTAKAADPKVRAIYGDAASDLKRTGSYVDQALEAVGPGTPTGLSGLMDRAMQRERGSARNANTAARTGALTDLQSKITGAAAGKALAYKAAKNTLTSSRNDLTQRLADLTGQSGSKMTALLSGMEDDRSKANTKTRESGNKTILSGPYRGHKQAEVDAATPDQLRQWEKQNTKTTGKGKGKSNRTTTYRQGQYSDDINEAAGIAAQLYAGGDSRHQIAQKLLHGTTVPPGTNKQPVPKFGQLVASAALDMAIDKHISRANADALHKRKLRVSDIRGAVSYQDWLKSPAGRAWQASRLVPGLGR